MRCAAPRRLSQLRVCERGVGHELLLLIPLSRRRRSSSPPRFRFEAFATYLIRSRCPYSACAWSGARRAFGSRWSTRRRVQQNRCSRCEARVGRAMWAGRGNRPRGVSCALPPSVRRRQREASQQPPRRCSHPSPSRSFDHSARAFSPIGTGDAEAVSINRCVVAPALACALDSADRSRVEVPLTD